MGFNEIKFLFLFLPITVAINTVIKKKWRNYVLLAASIVFYAIGEKFYVILLVVSALLNYTLARLIAGSHDNPVKSRRVIIIAVSINLAVLIFFRYTAFFIANINPVLSLAGYHPIEFKPIHIPLGISFFTFQILSYLIDVYRKNSSANTSLVETSVYITMFPQITSGPIIRYSSIAEQIGNRAVTLEGMTAGIQRFIIGLGKKMIIATSLGNAADQIFSIKPDLLSCEVAWLGSICYSLQLFFDFAGYSDMAIGIARMFGFRLAENFNYPYISQSMREFWRRWHISLSTWFRDYVYISLGGNRQSKTRTYVNIMIVFLLTGFWHGANWTFIIWGLWHGVFQLFERTSPGRFIEKQSRPVRHLYAVLVIFIGWVFFRSSDISGAWNFIKSMLGFNGFSNEVYSIGMFMNGETVFALTAAVVFSMPVVPLLEKRIRYGISLIRNSRVRTFAAHGFAIAGILMLYTVFLYSITIMSGKTYSPFIYSKF